MCCGNATGEQPLETVLICHQSIFDKSGLIGFMQING